MADEPQQPEGEAAPAATRQPPEQQREPVQEQGEAEKLDGVPWERRGSSRLGALWETLLLSLVKPAQFYAALPPVGPADQPARRGYLAPLTYAAWIVVLLFALQTAVMMLMVGLVAVRMILSLLFHMVALLFVYSLLAHLLLRALGAAKERFVATFRIVLYASGTMVLGLVPIFGGLLALCWQVVLVGLGLVTVQGATWGRAILATLLPYLVMGLVVALRACVPLSLPGLF